MPAGRPRKYATPEEARQARNEQYKAYRKRKRADAPKEPKPMEPLSEYTLRLKSRIGVPKGWFSMRGRRGFMSRKVGDVRVEYNAQHGIVQMYWNPDAEIDTDSSEVRRTLLDRMRAVYPGKHIVVVDGPLKRPRKGGDGGYMVMCQCYGKSDTYPKDEDILKVTASESL